MKLSTIRNILKFTLVRLRTRTGRFIHTDEVANSNKKAIAQKARGLLHASRL